MKFKYEGKAEITHFNARKEGPDDEKQLAVDLKFSVIAPHEILEFFDPQLRELYYTDIGAVRNPMIGPLQMCYEIKNYTLEMVDIPFNGVKLKKFVIEPRDNYQVCLTFQASFQPDSGIELIAEQLAEEVSISLLPESEELPFFHQAA